MIYAISGSNGFIGKHLVKRLKGLGHKVIALDRDGNLPQQVDYLIDLASYGNLYHQTEPDEIFNANVSRLIFLLLQVKKIKGIVLTSSSSTLLPVKTFYSVSKQTVEGLAEVFDLPIVVARPSTVIGPGESDQHLIPKLINSCFTREKMEFVGKPTHDFISVHDFVEAVILMSKNASKLKGKTLNISTGYSTSNNDIRQMVENSSGYKANLKIVKSLRKYDTDKWIVKPAPELKKLGWKIKVSLLEAIEEMVTEAFNNRF